MRAGGVEVEPKVVGQDVKETLRKLTAGEVDAALVYATDVKATPGLVGLRITPYLPGESEEPPTLKFPIASVSGSPEAKKFYDYVFSASAQAVLTDAGFALP